jgi:RND family efflux transporter MFP subunit
LYNTVIRAPISGIVATKFAEPGEIISPGIPILTLININTVKIAVDITEDNISGVKLGNLGEIKVDAYPDKVFFGKVIHIAPFANPASRAFRAELKVANPEQELKAGMFAKVKLITSQHKDTLIIPAKAVIREGGEDFVFVVEGSKAKMHSIKIGLKEEEQVEVISGLKEGDKVIIEGHYGLTSGRRVNVMKN